MNKKKPWMKFYPADWRSDTQLRSCSAAARGLWVDLMTIMHEADPYGHLLVNGRPPTTACLHNLLGVSSKLITSLLNELEYNGVFSKSPDGVIFSRRMVRDNQKEEVDRQNGKGGGNPKIIKVDKGGVNPPVNGVDKAQRLEARDEIDTPVAKAPGDGSYAFVGSVIRLTKRDFEKWRSAYSAITDLKAELQGIDDWLQGQPEDKRRRWFHAVSGMLSRKHQELAAAQPKLALTTHDVRWENTVRLWLENRKWYPDVDGPPPDHPQTRVPREILKIFNIQPEQS